MHWCQENNIPLDFVSTHQYAGDPIAGVEEKSVGAEGEKGGGQEPAGEEQAKKEQTEKLKMIGRMLEHSQADSFLSAMRTILADKSETEEIPNDTFVKNSALVRRQSKGLPVFYTEWNENAVFSAYTNDTRKVAAYLLKNILDVEPNLDGSSIWCFSDLFEEWHQFPEEFHGGFGLLTLDGVPKPGFYALKMLAQAGEERVDLGRGAACGEIGVAAFRDAHKMSVFLYRQKMKNLDLPKEEAIITIESDCAPAKVTLQRIDEDHGNPLKVWETMGRPQDMNREEVKKLKEASAVTEEDLQFTYKNGKIVFSASLAVNDIYCIHLYHKNDHSDPHCI